MCTHVGVSTSASISVRSGHSRHTLRSLGRSDAWRSKQRPDRCPESNAPTLHCGARNPEATRSPFECQLFTKIGASYFTRIHTKAFKSCVSIWFQSHSEGYPATRSGEKSSSTAKNFLQTFTAFLCSMLTFPSSSS